jgi:hypothetical protein
MKTNTKPYTTSGWSKQTQQHVTTQPNPNNNLLEQANATTLDNEPITNTKLCSNTHKHKDIEQNDHKLSQTLAYTNNHSNVGQTNPKLSQNTLFKQTNEMSTQLKVNDNANLAKTRKHNNIEEHNPKPRLNKQAQQHW